LKLSQLEARWNAARDTQYDKECKLDKIAEDASVATRFPEAEANAEEIKLHRWVPNMNQTNQRHGVRLSDSASLTEQDQETSYRRKARQRAFENLYLATLPGEVRKAIGQPRSFEADSTTLDGSRFRTLRR
jgi:hypothetical protein